MRKQLNEIQRMQQLAGINKKTINEGLINDDAIYNNLLNMDQEQLVSTMLSSAEENPELKLEDFLNEYGYEDEDEDINENESIGQQAVINNYLNKLRKFERENTDDIEDFKNLETAVSIYHKELINKIKQQ